MKKKKKKNFKNIFKLKKQIQRIDPKADKVEVKIDKSDQQSFETLIKVHIPPHKNLIAIKRDKSLKLSIEKSKQAIIKQVQKVKSKRDKQDFRKLKKARNMALSLTG